MRYGYFDDEKREYVIDRLDIPTSWTNYLGVEDFATVINHTAGGYSFYKSPEPPHQPLSRQQRSHGQTGVLYLYQR